MQKIVLGFPAFLGIEIRPAPTPKPAPKDIDLVIIRELGERGKLSLFDLIWEVGGEYDRTNHHVRQLERKGLLKRVIISKRNVLVKLTPEGLRFYQLIKENPELAKEKIIITCKFCGHEWIPINGIVICPKCHKLQHDISRRCAFCGHEWIPFSEDTKKCPRCHRRLKVRPPRTCQYCGYVWRPIKEDSKCPICGGEKPKPRYFKTCKICGHEWYARKKNVRKCPVCQMPLDYFDTFYDRYNHYFTTVEELIKRGELTVGELKELGMDIS
ncbi:MAG TPA: hypothetical protein ENF58_02085 [Candidatus Altiarchaeales archaeon]|nr:hypothetical protein [Candidatus Altiarchaeales archaeon]